MNVKRLSLIIVPAAVLTAASCEQSVQRVTPPPPKVTVERPIVRELVDSDPYNGWVDASQTVEVRARVRGHIVKVAFTDGQLVEKNAPLFELDPRPFEADVGRAKDQLKVFEAQLVAAKREEARLKDLLAKGGSSQSQVDKAEAEALSLAAQAEAAKQEIKRQELNLEYAKITSPISGRVSRAMLSEGNLVNAGGSDPLLTTVVAVDPAYVYFPVDERAMQRYMKARSSAATQRSGDLKAAQIRINFALETDTGFPHTALLDFADNQVDRKTGTILARATASNESGLLVAGSRVKVRVPVSDARSALLVPDTAIQSDQDRKYVLVVDDKNVVQRRDIAVAKLLDDGMRVVLAPASGRGISADDWIITLGIQSARINYPVEPVKAAPPTTAKLASN